ncbi:MAG: hypothetical protein K6F72_03660 [Bacteroidales bacterium]|nr:hypothetical protein [Bacteroidales bacterium]
MVARDPLVNISFTIRQILQMLHRLSATVGNPVGPTKMVAVAEKHHRLI